MQTTLGSAFTPKPTVQPDADEQTDAALLTAVQALTETVAALSIPAPRISLPAPQVRVDVPPLPAVPTAAEIGEAVARSFPRDDDTALLLAVTSVKDAVDKLAKKTNTPRFGGGTSLATGLPTLMNAAPASDTGQDAIPVRIVSQLGAGTGGGGSTGGLTNTELRAAPVPVSGTVSVSNFPATQPVSIASTVPVSGTFWQTTQPVSAAALPLPAGAATSAAQTDGTQKTQVTNFPVTQAVSLATNTPDVTDRAGRQLGHVTIDNATVTTADSRLPSALNGDGGLPTHVQNFPATQAVSAASLPLPAGAAQDGTDITTPFAMPTGGVGIRGWLSAIWTKLNGTVAVSLATNTPILGAGTNTVGNLNEIRAATTYATVVSSAVSLGATLTLAAPGAGLFHYITSIEITNYTGIARTGAATPVTVTTTNITGNPAYTFATAAAIGTTDIQRPIMATPLKVAAANTATTIVAPVTTGSFWRINVTYFVGA